MCVFICRQSKAYRVVPSTPRNNDSSSLVVSCNILHKGINAVNNPPGSGNINTSTLCFSAYAFWVRVVPSTPIVIGAVVRIQKDHS